MKNVIDMFIIDDKSTASLINQNEFIKDNQNEYCYLIIGSLLKIAHYSLLTKLKKR